MPIAFILFPSFKFPNVLLITFFLLALRFRDKPYLSTLFATLSIFFKQYMLVPAGLLVFLPHVNFKKFKLKLNNEFFYKILVFFLPHLVLYAPFDWSVVASVMYFNVGEGLSVELDSAYVITLAPNQYNMIGNPFPFPVAWSNVIKNGNIDTPYGYTGTGNSPSGFQPDQQILQPWAGYAVKNLESVPVSIAIPPIESTETALPKLLPDLTETFARRATLDRSDCHHPNLRSSNPRSYVLQGGPQSRRTPPA